MTHYTLDALFTIIIGNEYMPMKNPIPNLMSMPTIEPVK